MVRGLWLALSIVPLILLASGPATADPADTIGLSWQGRGSAGGATAGIDNWASTYYNPASLPFVEKPGLGTGLIVSLPEFTPGDAADPPQGFLEIGGAFPLVSFSNGSSVWLGMAAMMPHDAFYRIKLRPASEPVFLLHSSREQRLSLSSALAARLAGFISVSVGFEMLPVVGSDIAIDLLDRQGDNSVEVDVEYRLSPVAALSVRAFDKLKFGLIYRGRNHTELNLPVDVDAQGLSLSAEILAQTFFVPHRLSAGVEWQLLDMLAFEVGTTWYKYSDIEHPSPSVALYDSLGNDTLQAAVDKTRFSDTFALSLASRFTLFELIDMAAGYRYAPTPASAQTGHTNLLDSDHHMWGLGGRVPLLEGRQGIMSALYLGVDTAFTWLPERTIVKEQVLVDNPGYPTLTYGGHRFSLAVGLEAEY